SRKDWPEGPAGSCRQQTCEPYGVFWFCSALRKCLWEAFCLSFFTTRLRQNLLTAKYAVTFGPHRYSPDGEIRERESARCGHALRPRHQKRPPMPSLVFLLRF